MMDAGVFVRQGRFEVLDRPEPQLDGAASDWVKVEVEACGICGTDLQIMKVPPGYVAPDGTILGHEFIGRVVEKGPDAEECRVGDRVAVAPNLTCREQNRPWCEQCRKGRSNHCARWTTLGIHRDGGFAQYILAPAKALFPLTEQVSTADAVWIEPLSCVLGGFNRFDIEPDATAVVIGAGPIGILHGLMLKSAGVRVVISDLSAYRLAKADEAGLDVTVDAGSQRLQDAVNEMTEGGGADLIVDAVGGQLGTAIECAGMMGQICCFGHNLIRPEVNQFEISARELTIFGTYVGVNTFPQAIELLESGTLTPSTLNHPIMSIRDMQAGIDACVRGEAVKVVVSALA